MLKITILGISIILFSCTTSNNVNTEMKSLQRINSDTNSIYIKQHIMQEIKWYKWNSHNLELIRSLNKPVFLHIGYFGCHWCNKMSSDNFYNKKTVELLNEKYIPILIDKEEEPEINEQYLKYQNILMGQQGWPINMWLMPNLIPYYADSYVPSSSDDVMEITFNQLLKIFADKFENEYDKTQKIALQIRQRSLQHQGEQDTPEIDQLFGGYNRISKFISDYNLIEKQVQAYIYVDKKLHNHNIMTIHNMLKAGVYDKKNGGIHRYSVSRNWETPHFEKTLLDNSLLIQVLANQYYLSKDDFYFKFGNKTIDFIFNFLKFHDNLFASLISADSQVAENKVEGGFYLYNKAYAKKGCFKSYQKTNLYVTSIPTLNASTHKYCSRFYMKAKPIHDISPKTDLRAKFSQMIKLSNALLDFGIKTNTPSNLKKASTLYESIFSHFISDGMIYENCSPFRCYGEVSVKEISNLLNLSFKFLTLENEDKYIQKINHLISYADSRYKHNAEKEILNIKGMLNIFYDKKFNLYSLRSNSYFLVMVGKDNKDLIQRIKGTLFPYEAILIKNKENEMNNFFIHKKMHRGQTTLYICNNKTCLKPIIDFNEFYQQSKKLFQGEKSS